ncbi:MAG: autotransporter, partial [Endomicrobiales bacterium]
APPKILFSTEPSMLILVDGNPVFAPLKDTSLSRVINTQVLLLKDSTGKMYLHVFDGYMEAPGLAGPWKVSNALPPEIAGLDRRNLGSVDLLEGEPDQDTKQKPSLHTQIPHIYVSVEPAELVVTDGEPNYLPIDGTNLLYVSNTTANVFKNLNDQMTYIVISGRWFRSRSGNGPWEYVAGDSLPADFAKIPDTSTKENVKATIPNTEQAQEAAIANTVPTTEKIDRNTTQLNPEIDGDPQMLPIEGTPLNYVSNCSVPIIEVGADSWYAVSNGVWFVSSGPRGAWRVAQSVPSIIYSIPVTSPLHFVTYVRIYDAHPDFVYVGYTPGYYGTILDTDGIVVYGTGYVYRSYLRRNVWYGYPVTYGYGCSLCWTPMYGWSYGYGFGWGRQNYWYHPPVPYWGPYRSGGFPGYHNPAIWRMSTSANIYHRSFGAADRGHTFGAMNPAQLGRAYNSRTGALVVGNANAAKNVFTGVSLNNRFKPGSPGVVTSAVRPPVSVKNVNTHIDNNVYGTKEGHVYHFNPTARNWQHLNPAANNHQQQHPIAYLNRAQTARSAGNNRAKNFQQKSRAGSSNKNGRQ